MNEINNCPNCKILKEKYKHALKELKQLDNNYIYDENKLKYIPLDSESETETETEILFEEHNIFNNSLEMQTLPTNCTTNSQYVLARKFNNNKLELEESIMIVDNLDIKVSKNEMKAINKQNQLYNYSKVKKYINKLKIVYDVVFYTVSIGKYILPFL